MDKHKIGQADVHIIIRSILKGRKRGLKAHEVQLAYYKKTKKMMAGTAITARMRQMRDVVCDKTCNRYTYSLGAQHDSQG